MGVEWLARGRRGMKPLLLKVGLAVSLSVAGYLYSHLSSRADRRPRLHHHHRPHTASGVEGGREPCSGLKDELLHLQCEDASSNVNNGATITMVSSAIVDLYPSSKNSEDEEGCFLREFDALMLQEFESSGLDMVALEAPLVKRSPEKNGEKVAEQEIMILRTLVQSLKERERSLEIQLLEYYGLKEQESAVVEIENRLKISAMEADFLSLKIESLQAENRRLEAQVSDHSETKADLEAARAKIKHLKRKMKSESVQAKEKIAGLQQKIVALQDLERRWEEEEEEEAERRLKRLKDLEDEASELRRANSKLASENSDLAQKLESARSLACSTVESPKATKALEESNCLRQKNDQLAKQIEQLRTDRCTDVEELVYLRWVNACLRYELRNYQPPPGKTVARDLSRTLSPKSEHKVKQLILGYAKASDEKGVNTMDFDSEYCSSSHASSGEMDEALNDASTAAKHGSSGKKKFLTKLKKLVLGKDHKDGRFHLVDESPTSSGNSGRRASVSTCSFDEMVGRDPYDSAGSCVTPDNAHAHQLVSSRKPAYEQQQGGSPWTRDLSKVSLDFQRLRNHEELGVHNKSDVEASRLHMANIALCEETLLRSPQSARAGKGNSDDLAKLELERHAFSSRSPGEKPKLPRRSNSFSLC